MAQTDDKATPSFKPLYKQVKELLIQRLAAGEWLPGAMLPSEIALAAQYGVSQGTLRKALDEMAAERLVVRYQGKGTCAAQHNTERSLFQFFHIVGENGERELPTSRVISRECGSATPEEKKALGLPPESEVIRIFRIRDLNDQPTIAEHVIVSPVLFPDLGEFSDESLPNTLYALYQKKYGVTVGRAIEWLYAVAASEQDAEFLEVPSGTPLLEIRRIALDINNRPVEWRLSRCVTRHHHYLSELD